MKYLEVQDDTTMFAVYPTGDVYFIDDRNNWYITNEKVMKKVKSKVSNESDYSFEKEKSLGSDGETYYYLWRH